MSAVIRMKRHISELPHSAFVLNCKKQKTNDSQQAPVTSAETSTVLKFAGTVNQGEDVAEHIAKVTKEEAKDIVRKKTHHPDSTLKSRIDQNREKSQQNRFKIVNCTRATNEQEKSSSSQTAKSLTIVDVEKDRTSNTNQSAATASTSTALASSYSDISDEPFVYDIYIAAETDSSATYPDSIDLNDLSILDYNDYLYSRPRLVNAESDDEIDTEDEDSNDENNWRNDYPDEDEMSDGSVNEKQMRSAMKNFEIGNELSSDEEEDNGFVYSVDAEAISFEDDLDYCDVNRYGEAYARYKKKVLRQLNDSSDDSYGDDDNDSIHSSKDESFHSD